MIDRMGIQIPNSEYIDIHTASQKQYLNISANAIARLCRDGYFKSAYKPGTQGKTSKWLVLRSEVIAHRINGHARPIY